MSTYAIGDVQGCYQELSRLLEKINFGPKDELWLLGDLINRGPENSAVLNLAMSQPNINAILGNHDLHFMAVATGQQTLKRQDTLSDLINSPRRVDYIEYLRHRPLHHFADLDAPAVMVHAGVPPGFSIEKIDQLSNEVGATLKSDGFEAFLGAMYGNTPSIWSDALTGHDRLRVTTNYLTRLRYCNEAGEMELTHKSDVQPKGYAPWFSFPRLDELKIYFGHWAALEGKCSAEFAFALDTGCVWGGELTAIRLDDHEITTTNAVANPKKQTVANPKKQTVAGRENKVKPS
ncbi:MAG: bis(5'-nucleosyl)-tetraphosphatase (symmetrical) [Candidatus Azotimanducaceae bacterium]|jgi:bis(5'-nucleosyl)-tetraphosphatase (symmetrical)